MLGLSVTSGTEIYRSVFDVRQVDIRGSTGERRATIQKARAHKFGTECTAVRKRKENLFRTPRNSLEGKPTTQVGRIRIHGVNKMNPTWGKTNTIVFLACLGLVCADVREVNIRCSTRDRQPQSWRKLDLRT
jgi:hypothetical protein